MELNDKDNDELFLLSFDHNWAESKEKEQLILIERALKFSPGNGIAPVLAGMSSLYFSVRNKAKQGISYFKTKIFKLIENYSSNEELLYALKESALFSARIYNELKPDMPVQDIRFFCEVLLESGGRGPFYAWKFWQTEGISREILKSIALAVSEKARLFLVDQYLKAKPFVRKKFAYEFIKILQSIENQKYVMEFYAWLFDNQRYTDPFLFHLKPDLINSDVIISRGIGSFDPETRAQGLKALSMIIPRIEPSFLADFISDEENPIVRSAVFKLMGHSSPGTYSLLFENIYNFLLSSETIKKSEALEACIALFACRLISPLKLIEKLGHDVPHLIDDLSEKISTLPELSFSILLEMAGDDVFFRNSSKKIYKSILYGMIIKRPERILKILEKHGKLSNDELRMAVIQLANSITESLSREKQEVNEEISRFKTKFKQISSLHYDKKTSIFKSIFSDSLEKKIKLLKQENFDGDIDFQGEIVENADLSSRLFHNQIIFNGVIIRNSDFSDSSFLKSSFQKTIFLDVNLQGAHFSKISFDKAVFINVNADNAEFINCSFQGAEFFNSRFKNATMKGTVFIDSVIFQVSFSNADLSDASFACSKISSVSFMDSYLFQTDFTGIKAKFCRFPSHSNINIETDYADFNARLFRFDEKHLLDSLINIKESGFSFFSDINFLIFSECIHSGRKMFLKQNKFSILTALDIFKSRPADLFEIVPLLIHENINFPGYDAVKEKPPKGIFGYFPSRKTGHTAAKYLPEESLQLRACNSCYIESLFTIGSTGSIAQSAESDIDYWVCVRDNDYKGKLRLKFQKKLAQLEKWALDLFKTEIHFFVVDIEKVKIDDFGTSSVESSGSAQGKILKEEFYRTMIYVAGKLPFWCAVPVSISRNYYDKLYSMICIKPASCRYIDLGDIHDIPAGEYLGASIWQMFKWLKSPFKSVIKISLLEQFIDQSGKKPLLCNLFKEKWMNPALYFELSDNDPYYILLVSLIQYYEKSNNTEAIRFIQLCFFLKTGIASMSDISSGVFGLRKFFIIHCMEKWNWEMESVFKFGGFQHWQYDSIMKLSMRIEKYMIDTYKRIRHRLNTDSGQDSLIKPEDTTALGRKMSVQFADKPGKIKKILLISKNNYHFQSLNLKFCQDRKKTIFWELMHKSGKISRHREEILKKARTIEEIGAWLIHSKFYSERTLINLVPNPTPVTYDDIINLFNALNEFFSQDLYDTGFNVLLEKEKIISLFISMNFSVPRNMKKIFECSVIYMNSWGEMFSKFMSEKNGFDSIEELVKKIKKDLGIKSFPEKTAYYFHKKFKHIS